MSVMVKAIDGHCFLARDRRLGRRSWMYWKHVVAWQETALVKGPKQEED